MSKSGQTKQEVVMTKTIKITQEEKKIREKFILNDKNVPFFYEYGMDNEEKNIRIITIMETLTLNF